MTKPFDPSKPCTTRDGRPVRILCTDAPGPYPIVGYVNILDEIRIVGVTWNNEGKSAASVERDFDLINVPTKRKGWIGFRKAHGSLASFATTNIYDTKDSATRAIGTVDSWSVIEIEFDE